MEEIELILGDPLSDDMANEGQLGDKRHDEQHSGDDEEESSMEDDDQGSDDKSSVFEF